MVHIQELPDEILIRVLWYCPDAVAKGVVPLLNKWFRAFVHRTARPVAALRRELLLQNLVFKVGALDWPGSRGCQRTTGVSRMRPLVRSRPTRASPNYEREPGDIPLSLNAFSVDSTLVWDALPERIREFLGMTRMTLQLREVWAPVGFAKLQQLLSELQAESRGLGVCSATRDRLAATYEHLAAVLRQSSDTFLVVSFPLLGRHGARLGVRPQKEMVHILVPMGDAVLPETEVKTTSEAVFLTSPTGAVPHTLTRTEFIVSYANVADRIRRHITRAPRPVGDPVLRTQLSVHTTEPLATGEEFRHSWAVAADRRANIDRVAILAQRQAASASRGLRRTPQQQQSRRLAQRLVPFERVERMCAALFAQATADPAWPPEVVNFALCHIVVLGATAIVPLRYSISEFGISEAMYMGHISTMQELQRQFGIVTHILDECLGVQRTLLFSNAVEVYPTNIGRPEPPRFILVDFPDRDDPHWGLERPDLAPRVVGRVGDDVCHTESGSIAQFVAFRDVLVGDELTVHIVNAFEPRHWNTVFKQHTVSVATGLRTCPQCHTHQHRQNLGVTAFLMTLAEYTLDRSRRRVHAWSVGDQVGRFDYMQDEVRRTISSYYGQLVARGFPQDYSDARVVNPETGTLLGPGGIRMRPDRLNLDAHDIVRVLPGRAVVDGVVKVPVHTHYGLFLLVCEANLAMEGPAWVGPGRVWAPEAPAPAAGREAAIEVLQTCMISTIPSDLGSAAPPPSPAVDWDAIVDIANPRMGFSELLYSRLFCNDVIEEWYSSGTEVRRAIDYRRFVNPTSYDEIPVLEKLAKIRQYDRTHR